MVNQQKLTHFVSWLNQNELSGAIITNFHDVAYFSGFESDPIERVLALVVFSDHEPLLFGPALEVNSMRASGWPFAAFGYADHENPWLILAQHIKQTTSGTKFGIEYDHLSVARFNALQTALPSLSFKTDVTNEVNQLRLLKTPAEIEHMMAAGKDADRALTIGFQALTSGISELAVSAKIEYELKKSGVAAMSFDTLVQFGTHAADPHGATATRELATGEMALFDLGTITEGYASDVSRTIAFGQVDPKLQEIHAVTLAAQQEAQSQAKVGMTAAELDGIARQIITDAGYGDYFVHRLGHGLGTSVHEYPSIMAGNNITLQEGMAFSIEPGIYIPGLGGVRIEDSGYMSHTGFIPITTTSKSLYQL